MPDIENNNENRIEAGSEWVPSELEQHGDIGNGDDAVCAGQPMRFIFGDMAGAVFLAWMPVFAVFFFPWSVIGGNTLIFGSMTLANLIIAVIIALPPWIVLTRHLARGHLGDGIIEMFLWAFWECLSMITLCYLYPDRAQLLIWNAGGYWEEMRTWLATGAGAEGNPGIWISIHLQHVILIIAMGFLGGLLALVMGVLQLNYMNYYVAQVMLASGNPIWMLPIAWHFWSVIRVAGFIVVASSMYQLFLRMVKRAPVRPSVIWGGILCGLALVVLDGVLKWQFADTMRLILKSWTGL